MFSEFCQGNGKESEECCLYDASIELVTNNELKIRHL